MTATRPPVDYIERTREQYDSLGYPPYRWVENATPGPFAPLAKPISSSKLALIASGGVYQAGQIAFHYKDDFSFRVLDTNLATDSLRATHFAYDLTDARRDANVVFPIDTLRAMVDEGTLGGLGPHAYTFMGGIYSSRLVREKLAPAIADRVIADEVDVVLLVPV